MTQCLHVNLLLHLKHVTDLLKHGQNSKNVRGTWLPSRLNCTPLYVVFIYMQNSNFGSTPELFQPFMYVPHEQIDMPVKIMLTSLCWWYFHQSLVSDERNSMLRKFIFILSSSLNEGWIIVPNIKLSFWIVFSILRKGHRVFIDWESFSFWVQSEFRTRKMHPISDIKSSPTLAQ